jgi:hypothetical protein
LESGLILSFFAAISPLLLAQLNLVLL